MLIPWQDLSPETLENLIESFVLREGTDYGEHERTLEQKVADDFDYAGTDNPLSQQLLFENLSDLRGCAFQFHLY